MPYDHAAPCARPCKGHARLGHKIDALKAGEGLMVRPPYPEFARTRGQSCGQPCNGQPSRPLALSDPRMILRRAIRPVSLFSTGAPIALRGNGSGNSLHLRGWNRTWN